MIYLIGGAPRCGKTTLAKMIAKKRGSNFIQTDYISSALSTKISVEEKDAIFGKKANTDENWKDNETRFSVFSNQEQIDIYRKKAEWNRSGIRNMIEYGIFDQDEYVFEGYHLRPSILYEDIKKWGTQVKYIILYKSNTEEIEKGIKANNNPNDRAKQHTFKEETYKKISSFVHDFGEVLHQEAVQYGIQSYDMNGIDFHTQLDTICLDVLSH